MHTHTHTHTHRITEMLKNALYLADIQFSNLLRVITDLGKDEIYLLFELFDLDASGVIEFSEFYLLMCILIATKVRLNHNLLHTTGIFICIYNV